MPNIPKMIRKILTMQVKAVEGKDRVLEFVGTTETVDRDGEIIKADAWQTDKYIKNPVVLWAHRYDEPPIGKTLSIERRGTDTVFEIEFADKETYEFADTIYKLSNGGFLNATSVGFIPIEFGKSKDSNVSRVFTKVELLEISIVPVPSNPDALITAREAGLISVKEFESIKKEIPVLKPQLPLENVQVVNEVVPKPKEATEHAHTEKLSQTEIRDELDYVLKLIKEYDMSKDTLELCKALKIELQRLTGNDMPVDIPQNKIRQDMIVPIIKLIDEHHGAHQKCYKACKSALEAMCGGRQETVSGYIEAEIRRQIAEVK